MNTFMSAVVVNSKGRSDLAKLEENEMEEAAKKALAILNGKVRKKYYHISGSSALEGDEMDKDYLFEYTDEQVAYIKQVGLRLYNQEFGCVEGEVGTFSEVKDLHELEGIDDNLDKWVINPALDADMLVDALDLDQVHYLYEFTCHAYDEQEGKMLKGRTGNVELSDEEYLWLLTRQIYDRKFTFNKLLQQKPELAQKIISQLEHCHYGYVLDHDMPYLIQMNELRLDVENLLGSEL